MGRSQYVLTMPFYLACQRNNAEDERLEVSWEEPEEWEPVNGWEPAGVGELTDETEWVKGDLVVEVGFADLQARALTYFAAKDRVSLETWKKDHKLKGQIRVDHQVIHGG